MTSNSKENSGGFNLCYDSYDEAELKNFVNQINKIYHLPLINKEISIFANKTWFNGIVLAETRFSFLIRVKYDSQSKNIKRFVKFRTLLKIKGIILPSNLFLGKFENRLLNKLKICR